MLSSSRSARNAVVFAAVVSAAFAAAPAGSQAATGWAWPVRGPLVTAYSNDNSRPYAGGMHRGIDVAAPAGAGVTAARSGRVTFAGPLGSSGLTVAIATAEGRYATSYLHLGGIAVKRGQAVTTGQKIGEVGTTGKRAVTAPHLHFGVRLAGPARLYVDPMTVLPPAPGVTPVAPLPVPARAPAPRRTELAPVPVAARLAPVPAAPGLAPVPARRRVPAPVPARRRVPAPWAVPEGGDPVVWGPLVSLAGLLLLGAVLGSRVGRSGSGAAGREDGAQPSPRSAPAAVSGLESVSQVG